MTEWAAVLIASAVGFGTKLAGYLVPPAALSGPRSSVLLDPLPAAMLAALVVLQTFAAGSHLVLDARAAGLVVAIVALLLRAPFIVVVVLAAATAAALRAAGWS